jgi:hypothetical protein
MYQGYTERPEVIEAKRRAIASGKLLPSQRRARPGKSKTNTTKKTPA